MKKKVIIISFLVFLILVSISCVFRIDCIRLDGLSGELFGLILPSDTKYSEKYSHNKFAKINIGMTEKQVVEIIGEPLTKWKPYSHIKEKHHFIGFQYSDSPSSSNYRLRQIYFDNGKVAEIISYFYLD